MNAFKILVFMIGTLFFLPAQAKEMLQTTPYAGLIMTDKDSYELRGRVVSYDKTNLTIETPFKIWTVNYSDFDFNKSRREHLDEKPVVQVFGEMDDVYADKAKIIKPEGMIMYLQNGMKYTFRKE